MPLPLGVMSVVTGARERDVSMWLSTVRAALRNDGVDMLLALPSLSACLALPSSIR